MYSYGLYNSVATSCDTLLLVFSAVVLGASIGVTGLIDALGYAGSLAGVLIMGRLADKFHSQRFLIVGGFLATSACLVAMALTNQILLVLPIGTIWGFVIVAHKPSASVLITRLFPRNEWATQQLRLGRFNDLGSTAGLAFTILWLSLAKPAMGDATSMRIVFVIGACIALLAAASAWILLPGPKHPGEHQARPSGKPEGAGDLVSAWSLTGQVSTVRDYNKGLASTRRENIVKPERRPYGDRLTGFLFVTIVLYMGVGMAATLLPVFLATHLDAPSYKVLGATLLFFLASSMTYPIVDKILPVVYALRLHAVASLSRGIIVFLMGIVGLLMPPSPAQWMIILLTAMSGVCWAAVSGAASSRVVLISPIGRKGEAAGSYSAVGQIGAFFGALIGGYFAPKVGYFPAFSLAALLIFIASALSLRM